MKARRESETQAPICRRWGHISMAWLMPAAGGQLASAAGAPAQTPALQTTPGPGMQVGAASRLPAAGGRLVLVPRPRSGDDALADPELACARPVLLHHADACITTLDDCHFCHATVVTYRYYTHRVL